MNFPCYKDSAVQLNHSRCDHTASRGGLCDRCYLICSTKGQFYEAAKGHFLVMSLKSCTNTCLLLIRLKTIEKGVGQLVGQIFVFEFDSANNNACHVSMCIYLEPIFVPRAGIGVVLFRSVMIQDIPDVTNTKKTQTKGNYATSCWVSRLVFQKS